MILEALKVAPSFVIVEHPSIIYTCFALIQGHGNLLNSRGSEEFLHGLGGIKYSEKYRFILKFGLDRRESIDMPGRRLISQFTFPVPVKNEDFEEKSQTPDNQNREDV